MNKLTYILWQQGERKSGKNGNLRSCDVLSIVCNTAHILLLLILHFLSTMLFILLYWCRLLFFRLLLAPTLLSRRYDSPLQFFFLCSVVFLLCFYVCFFCLSFVRPSICFSVFRLLICMCVHVAKCCWKKKLEHFWKSNMFQHEGRFHSLCLLFAVPFSLVLLPWSLHVLILSVSWIRFSFILFWENMTNASDINSAIAAAIVVIFIVLWIAAYIIPSSLYRDTKNEWKNWLCNVHFIEFLFQIHCSCWFVLLHSDANRRWHLSAKRD